MPRVAVAWLNARPIGERLRILPLHGSGRGSHMVSEPRAKAVTAIVHDSRVPNRRDTLCDADQNVRCD